MVLQGFSCLACLGDPGVYIVLKLHGSTLKSDVIFIISINNVSHDATITQLHADIDTQSANKRLPG